MLLMLGTCLGLSNSTPPTPQCTIPPRSNEPGGIAIPSRKSKSDEIETVEIEDLVDPENVAAILGAIKTVKRKVFKLTLPNGSKLPLPFHVCGQALSMEAMSGEKRVGDNDKINPKRDRRIWIRRVNAGLEDGWKFIDVPKDRANVGARELPYEIVTVEDANKLIEAMYPGTFQTSSDIQDGLDTSVDDADDGVSRSENAE